MIAERKVTIHWILTNPGHQPDEGGYWISSERRFRITPRFRHTVYPDGYTLNDTSGMTYNYDSVRECKIKALGICQRELSADLA